MISVQVKRLDETLPMPQCQTEGSVGYDLCARLDTLIQPGEVKLIPLNVIVKCPVDHMILLALRSSTPRKKGLAIPNGIGVIDQDYCGPNDELHAQVINFTQVPVTVERGERICQMLFIPVITPLLTELKVISGSSRGGFGSTG